MGVRTCLTWKPLSVLTLMGRPKQGRLGALSLPPSTPKVSGTTVALSSAELQSGVWNTPQPPPRPLHPGAAVSHHSPPPTPPAPLPQPPLPYSTNPHRSHTPIRPSLSPPSVQSGQALLRLTSLVGAEQRPTRHRDNETGVQWPRKGTPLCLCESEQEECMWASVHMCYCTGWRRCIS